MGEWTVRSYSHVSTCGEACAPGVVLAGVALVVGDGEGGDVVAGGDEVVEVDGGIESAGVNEHDFLAGHREGEGWVGFTRKELTTDGHG